MPLQQAIVMEESGGQILSKSRSVRSVSRTQPLTSSSRRYLDPVVRYCTAISVIWRRRRKQQTWREATMGQAGNMWRLQMKVSAACVPWDNLTSSVWRGLCSKMKWLWWLGQTEPHSETHLHAPDPSHSYTASVHVENRGDDKRDQCCSHLLVDGWRMTSSFGLSWLGNCSCTSLFPVTNGKRNRLGLHRSSTSGLCWNMCTSTPMSVMWTHSTRVKFLRGSPSTPASP